MKHPVRDRLLMLLYALASLCIAAALIAMVFDQITPDMISGAAAQIRALPGRTIRITMIVCAVVLVLLALALISAMFPPKKKRSSSFAIQHNENGTVRIALKTIDALVQKCLSQHSELKVVTSSLFSDEETVRVDVHIVLLADISMPLAISALQKQITKYVEACSGVNIREVRVFVDGALSNGEQAAQSKYVLPSSLLVEAPLTEELDEASEPVQEVPNFPAEEAMQAEVPETPEVLEETAVAQAEFADEAQAADETSADEEAPLANETAAEEPVVDAESSTGEEAPAGQEPASGKKKIFGLFSKK